jgi:hypothetical protein
MPKSMAAVMAAVCVSAGLAAAQNNASASTFETAAAAMTETMRRHHYNPAALLDPAYAAAERAVTALAARAQTHQEFVNAVNAIWRNGPFSHVNLQIAKSSAGATAAYLDTMNVGGNGARLTWTGDIAVLTVTTMMGADTIEQITAAYQEIATQNARALIVDLRENPGGAFAVRPLIGHILRQPFDAGAFVSRQWAREGSRAPTRADIEQSTPWDGWTLTAFWRDAEGNPLTRIRFDPLTPHFDGPIAVLVSGRTASAAELAADAFRASGRAVLVGEKTAGKMLSQKVFDLPQGLQVFLPIADYYSLASGRIEGAGLAPDVPADSASAMVMALERLTKR